LILLRPDFRVPTQLWGRILLQAHPQRRVNFTSIEGMARVTGDFVDVIWKTPIRTSDGRGC
ncbi:MAG: hypothetical protein LBQ12_07595, partial [Deltaproteobacteria bacterium]|nr:hypothetical protein [Deltaproteobacteria bacterium]